MWKRIALPLIGISIVGLSLAAVAAVNVTAVPTRDVTPQVHKSGDDGYFRIQLPLPKGAPAGPMGLAAKVESGDCWLVTASSPNAPPGVPRETDADDEPLAANEARPVTITGRYSHG